MQAIDKSNGATVAKNGKRFGVSSIPGELAGTYQAGYEAGYTTGQESGFRRGRAIVNQSSANDADATLAGVKTAAKREPRRMLLGMPCAKCRIYLYSEDTRCPVGGCPRERQELKSARVQKSSSTRSQPYTGKTSLQILLLNVDVIGVTNARDLSRSPIRCVRVAL